MSRRLASGAFALAFFSVVSSPLKPRSRRSRAIDWLACLVMLAAPALQAAAQGANRAWQSYEDRLGTVQEFASLGPNFAGDEVGLQTGSLSFAATDISLPGNDALAVAVTRDYRVFNRRYYGNVGMLADWDLRLPSISGVFAPNWAGRSSASSGLRCSEVGAYPLEHFNRNDWWTGLTLTLPSGQEPLLNPKSGTTKPATGGPYTLMTNSQTFVSCLASIRNGTGQGFLAITADGTRYWFDWMAQYGEPGIVRTPIEMGRMVMYVLKRARNVLYATRVEDRFGNVVSYTYTNSANAPARLASIASSDGRAITFGYDGAGRLASATANGRTWTYSYSTTPSGRVTLSEVRNPDASKWTLRLAGLTDAEIHYADPPPGEWLRDCWTHQIADNEGAQPVGSITHPSGGTATFRVGIIEHSRSNVPISCSYVTSDSGGELGKGNDPNDDINFWVISHQQFSLLEKTVSGPGLPPGQRWSYAYQSDYSAYFTGGGTFDFPYCSSGTFVCGAPRCTDDSCAGSSLTTVTGPSGVWDRYRYGNSFKYNEGLLISHERGAGTNPPARTSASRYELRATHGVYPASFGYSLKGDDGFAEEYVRPVVERRITQDASNFVWQVEQGCTAAGVYCFDRFVRPTKVTRKSY